jgi:hypothetical protein
MNKALAGFMLFYLINILVGGVLEGGGGMASTRLTLGESAIDVTIDVADTTSFLKSDYVVIANEKIRYTNKTDTTFTVPATNGRGYSGTIATVHPVGAMVYSPESNMINGILGFNVASTGTTVGAIDVGLIFNHFWTQTVPRLITWDFPQLKIGWMVYLRIVCIVITGTLIIIFLAQILNNIASAIFSRVTSP